jgi:hypothetical protein
MQRNANSCLKDVIKDKKESGINRIIISVVKGV